MSDYSVYLDLRAPAPMRLPESMSSTAPADSTSPAPVAALNPRIAVPPPAETLAVPPSPERLRPQVLTAEATASSLATRQSSYAEIDRTLAQTSSALRSSAGPIDVRGTLSELGSRLETRRTDETRAIGDAVRRVNELSDQVARYSARSGSGGAASVDGDGPDPAYRRDVAVQALARLTGATVAAPGSPGAASGAAGVGAGVPVDGPVDLTINGYPLVQDGQAVALGLGRDEGGRLVVTGPDGAPVPVDSGVIGGRLQLVNDVLPQVIRGVAALSAVIGGIKDSEAPQAAGSALAAVAAQARSGQVAPAVAAFLDSVRSGSVLQPTASLVSAYLGAVDPADDERRGAITSALQQINHVVTRLGAAADAAAVAAANTTSSIVTSSAPHLVTAAISGPTQQGAVSFAVLSAAGPGGVVSEQEFISGRPLNDGEPFEFGVLTRDDTGTPTQSVFAMGPTATISDVVAAINNSNAGVRATLSTIAAGTVQLSVISLRTGRFSDVTVSNGQQPPNASTILGRFNRLMDAKDTVLRVDSGPQAGSLAVSTSPNVSGLMDGVTVSVQQADPTKVVTLATAPDPRVLATKVDAMINSAAGVLASVWQATQAGSPLAGDRMLADMAGRIVGAITGPAPVRGMPGLDLRGGGMAFDRDAFLRAFTRDPVAAEAQVGAVAARLSTVAASTADPVVGFIAMRLASTQDVRQGYGASKAAPDERLTSRQVELKRRGSALESLLGHLTEQADWLRGQLAGYGSGARSPVVSGSVAGAGAVAGSGAAVSAASGVAASAGRASAPDAITEPLPRIAAFGPGADAPGASASAAGARASAPAESAVAGNAPAALEDAAAHQAPAVGPLAGLASLLAPGSRQADPALPA